MPGQTMGCQSLLPRAEEGLARSVRQSSTLFTRGRKIGSPLPPLPRARRAGGCKGYSGTSAAQCKTWVSSSRTSLDHEINVNNWVKVQGPVKQTVANKLRDEGAEQHAQNPVSTLSRNGSTSSWSSPAKGREGVRGETEVLRPCLGLSRRSLAAGAAGDLFPVPCA